MQIGDSMKRFNFLNINLLLFFLLVSSWSLTSNAQNNMRVVAVTAIVDHPALNAVRDGIKVGLKKSGYVEGKNLKFIFQSAQGSPSTAAQIARRFIGDKVDVIVPISTPSAQAVAAVTRDIPFVFSAISDPIAAKLVNGRGPSGTNITGISDLSPIAKQMELIAKVDPKVKRLGVIYSPGEANSVAIVEIIRKEMNTRGWSLVEAPAQRTVDIAGATESLIGKVDAFYIPTDNNVMSSVENIARIARQAKIPLFAADTDSVKRGAVAAMGLNYHDIGIQTGELVARILKGESPGNIPFQEGEKFEIHINKREATKQGVTLSTAVVNSATFVID